MTEDPRDPTDDDLLGMLSRALGAVETVPAHVTEAASAALTWRTIDVELAEVSFDSAEQPLGVRSTDVNRQVTFRSGEVEIEVMITEGDGRRLVGQVIPPAGLDVELVSDGGQRVVSTDHLGRFTFDELRSGPTRLVLRDDDGAPIVQSSWLLI